MKSCRLIDESEQLPSSNSSLGARHMAVDEALLRSAAESQVTTLRFYRWPVAVLSLGYFQRVAQRETHPASAECQLVRRASGGGAILHDEELTYCFATPTDARLANAQHFYLDYHETLVELLRQLGIEASLQPAEEVERKDAFLCFHRRSSGDVILDDAKVAGSAQRRWKHGLVQHGSVLLRQSRYAPELPGIRELTGIDLDPATLAKAWQEKLALRLKTAFHEDPLTDIERAESERLAIEKFARKSWTHRR